MSANHNMGLDIYSAIRWYNRYHNSVRVILSLLGENALVLRYEDLINNPDVALANLQKFIGVDQEQLLKPFGSDVHWIGNMSLFKFTGHLHENEKWKNELTPEEIDEVMAKTRNIRKYFGYN